eukprot:scaffold1060_cov196-Amphora_coffeaeformis.AAC.35
MLWWPRVLFRQRSKRYQSLSCRCLRHSRTHTSLSTSDPSSSTSYSDLCHDVRDLLARAAPSLGNSGSKKLWRRFLHRFCAAAQEGVRLEIASQVDWDATQMLKMNLARVGADTGIMPDFAHNPGALCGYTLGHFGRVRLLIDLMTQSDPDWLVLRMDELLGGAKDKNNNHRRNDNPPSEILQVASLGGGPAFDFMAWLALSEFRRGPCVQATVYEYEPNWQPLVNQIKKTSLHVLDTQRHDCLFESCDITLSLDAAVNANTIGSLAGSPNIVFTCSYVVAENAVKLRQNDFCFFRQLFSEASPGALFFFTETTHRLWPELVDLAQRTSSLRVAMPHIRRGKAGCQLVLFKDDTIGGDICIHLSVTDQEKYARFKRDNEAHLAWLERRG